MFDGEAALCIYLPRKSGMMGTTSGIVGPCILQTRPAPVTGSSCLKTDVSRSPLFGHGGGE